MYDEKNIQWNLQMEIRNLKLRIAELESGRAYNALKEKNNRQHDRYERELKKRDRVIESLREQIRQNMEMWFRVFKDVQDECLERGIALEKLLMEVCGDVIACEAKNRELKQEIREHINEVIEARQETQEQKEINQKLNAIINQDYTNSSVPSSQSPFRGKVTNNREKTDRLPGGQPGHEGHKRPHSENPDNTIMIEDDPAIVSDPDYYPVKGKNGIIRKQLVGLIVMPYFIEYAAQLYRSRSTGKRVHAAFPEGVVLETNYDAGIRSLIFTMKNHLNVSEAKISEFISDITKGMLKPSRGMINSINKEFAAKTETERKETFDKLVKSGVLYTDFTNVRQNGKLKNVLVVTDKEDVLYFFRDTKGDAAIQGTPLEYFMNVLVHDHAATFFHYGSEHQDCCIHKMRRAKGVSENEPDHTWSGKMYDLLSEMNKTRNKAEGLVLTEEQITGFEKRYNEILDLADKEYYDDPPGEYYRKGINLAKEMRDYKDSVLFFLRHPEVDFTNNISEQLARSIKRHMVVMGTFRGGSNESGEDYCASMSVLQSAKMKGENVTEKIKEIFGKIIPQGMQPRDEKGRFIKETETASDTGSEVPDGEFPAAAPS